MVVADREVLVQRRHDRNIRSDPTDRPDRLDAEAEKMMEVHDVRVDVVDEFAEVATQCIQVAVR